MEVNLSQMSCKNSVAITLLSDSEIENYLVTKLPGWRYNRDKKQIHRKFEFKNFKQTMFFVNALAYICEKEAHHPDMLVGFNYCMVNFSTHDIGGISINDIICAYKINNL